MKPLMIVLISLSLLLSASMAPAAFNWQELFMSDDESGYFYTRTSELKDPGPRDFGPYGAHNLFDQNPKTCWAEGAPGPGIGEAVFVEIRKGERTIHVMDGYFKSAALFQKNNRVRKFRLSLWAGIFRPDLTTELFFNYHAVKYGREVMVTLKDVMATQRFPFPWDWAEAEMFMQDASAAHPEADKLTGVPDEISQKYIIKFEIAEVYKGTKYDDTCISEIWMSR